MEHIWDIIISNTDNMDGERLFKELICTPNYGPYLAEEEINTIFTDNAAENQCIIEEIVYHLLQNFQELLNTKGLSARKVIDACCNLLLDFPQCDNKDVSVLSNGTLVRSGSSITSLETGHIYDILEANLYCVLLLEAKGQRLPNNESYNLTHTADIAESFGLEVNYSRLSRLLSSNTFPAILKELFAVEQNGKEPYSIHTPYCRLLAAELDRINISPLSSSESAAYSCIQNKTFYDICINAINISSDNVLDSIADYYLFERFFRLNTKFQLFWKEYQLEIDESTLSPALLGDFFYSSPLVLFPDRMLSSLIYAQTDSLPAYMPGAQFLHFLIQLSSYWFPIVLYILRHYMGIHAIKSPDDVKSFFSGSTEFSALWEIVIPKCELEVDIIKGNRRIKDDYAKRWKCFSPDKSHYLESLTPLTLEEWCFKKYSKTYTVEDCIALREIQETLFY